MPARLISAVQHLSAGFHSFSHLQVWTPIANKEQDYNQDSNNFLAKGGPSHYQWWPTYNKYTFIVQATAQDSLERIFKSSSGPGSVDHYTSLHITALTVVFGSQELEKIARIATVILLFSLQSQFLLLQLLAKWISIVLLPSRSIAVASGSDTAVGKLPPSYFMRCFRLSSGHSYCVLILCQIQADMVFL